jgi:probable rRNA maturation factor
VKAAGRVTLRNWQRQFRLPTGGYRRLALAALPLLQAGDVRLTVVYCTEARIRGLNRDYRGIDAPTDVLSFPDGEREEDGATYLGEIFIAPAVALANARAYGAPFAREMAELHLHGLLHLLGHDHETDRGEMLALQRRLLDRLADRIPAVSPAG